MLHSVNASYRNTGDRSVFGRLKRIMLINEEGNRHDVAVTNLAQQQRTMTSVTTTVTTIKKTAPATEAMMSTETDNDIHRRECYTDTRRTLAL